MVTKMVGWKMLVVAVGWIVIEGTSLAAMPSGVDEPTRPAKGGPRVGEREKKEADSSPEARKREIKASVELWQDRVQKRIQAVDEMAKTLDLKKISSQKIASAELIGLLEDLDEEAVAIIDASETVGPDLEMYRNALLRAVPSFEKLANDLERNASMRKHAEIQGLYADFIGQSKRLANYYAEKARSIDGVEEAIMEQISFVRESREFIADVRGLLEAIPTEGGLELEKLVDRINQYIDSFRKAIDTMRGVTEKIGAPASSKSDSVPTPGSSAGSMGRLVTEAKERLSKLGK